MTLKLYMHPLSSYSQKVVIALYENETPFQAMRLDDPAIAQEFKALWPMARFPLLRDEGRDRIVAESSIIIEYLALHYPGKVKLIPDAPDLSRETRLQDRFFDLYVHTPVQRVVADRRRPQAKRDPLGMQEVRTIYRTALQMVESAMAAKTWAIGEDFTLADCAAAPALFYANIFFGPLHPSQPNAGAYLERLMARPSYARALQEAKPYMHLLPK
ncbi:MAG TPA: glutathione S-transferase family protein [Steroidobacteraceae bacterium]